MYHYLIIYAIKQLKGQRSIASIYHIISGRRSAQTIQDAHFYQMTRFYSIYQQLKRKDFEATLNSLSETDYIQIDQNEIASLTSKGTRYLNDQQDHYSINRFKGLEYANKVTPFSERLSLTIQTYSNLSMANSIFQPVTDRLSVQKWVKRNYAQNQSIQDWLTTVFQYLKEFLTEINEQQAKLLVDRLTGYRKYGLSTQQLALKYHLPIDDINLLLTLSYHQLIHFIETHQIRLLNVFIPDDQHQIDQFITNSALKTHHFISKGYSIEKTMQMRRLKRSTIEDHIVELTYAIPDFNLKPYINQSGLNDIWDKVQHVDEHRLSKIKALLGDEYNYFQIRLAMAKAQLK